MFFQFGFYSSILLISFTHGIVYSILLFFKAVKDDNKSNYWLSLFLFLCSLYIAPWMLGFAGWYDNQPFRDIMFYMTFQHLFLLGPVIFFYVQSLLNPNFKLNKQNFLHLLPGILYIIYSIVIVVTDKLILKRYYFLADNTDREFDSWYQYAGFFSMLFYFGLSLRYYLKFQKLMPQLVSFSDNLVFKWIKTFLMAFLVMLILQVVTYIFGVCFPNTQSYIGSWWYFFFFSIIMYYIAITGYANSQKTTIPFSFDLFQSNKVFLLPMHENEKVEEIDFEEIEKSKPIKEDIQLWKNKIVDLFEIKMLFKNPDLTLTDLAKNLDTNVAIISRTINQGFQLNFNDFINQYRVETVKKAFEKGEHKKSTLLGIAFDCGFNSKATFNRAFKKNTGLSPKEYLEKLKS